MHYRTHGECLTGNRLINGRWCHIKDSTNTGQCQINEHKKVVAFFIIFTNWLTSLWCQYSLWSTHNTYLFYKLDTGIKSVFWQTACRVLERRSNFEYWNGACLLTNWMPCFGTEVVHYFMINQMLERRGYFDKLPALLQVVHTVFWSIRCWNEGCILTNWLPCSGTEVVFW